MVLLRCGDFGPNLVVFFVFWGFDQFRVLEVIYLLTPYLSRRKNIEKEIRKLDRLLGDYYLTSIHIGIYNVRANYRGEEIGLFIFSKDSWPRSYKRKNESDNFSIEKVNKIYRRLSIARGHWTK